MYIDKNVSLCSQEHTGPLLFLKDLCAVQILVRYNVQVVVEGANMPTNAPIFAQEKLQMLGAFVVSCLKTDFIGVRGGGLLLN